MIFFNKFVAYIKQVHFLNCSIFCHQIAINILKEKKYIICKHKMIYIKCYKKQMF